MIDLNSDLPYELSKNVFARKEGLRMPLNDHLVSEILSRVSDRHGPRMKELYYYFDGEPIPWWAISEALSYKQGEPGCMVRKVPKESGPDSFVNLGPEDTVEGDTDHVFMLHRLTAIVCDNSKAMRVLYDCISRFGNAETKER